MGVKRVMTSLANCATISKLTEYSLG
jgi:hypothetical protein